MLFELTAIPPFPRTPDALCGLVSRRYHATRRFMQRVRFCSLISAERTPHRLNTPLNMTETSPYAEFISSSVRVGKFPANIKVFLVIPFPYSAFSSSSIRAVFFCAGFMPFAFAAS